VNCIEVSAGKNLRGYGTAWVPVGPRARHRVSAHRLAFERAWGVTAPQGMVVMHTCDNPGCVNPMHLMLGTQKDNIQDMHRKGRDRNQHTVGAK
jgi:hypothetical protein